ncbi:hypothetical protein PAUR_a1279 [Pseudoalteromonas aurantia 208]|uniref:Uncharacterized protein n=1 Tax=Pseudoalteromonas aurantia 208 TaxID=1314867 RepID=A0ABR9EA16_9GAMM|nr:hypothetical protein [Pseudoalteromonas aurantia 208]
MSCMTLTQHLVVRLARAFKRKRHRQAWLSKLKPNHTVKY